MIFLFINIKNNDISCFLIIEFFLIFFKVIIYGGIFSLCAFSITFDTIKDELSILSILCSRNNLHQQMGLSHEKGISELIVTFSSYFTLNYSICNIYKILMKKLSGDQISEQQNNPFQ